MRVILLMMIGFSLSIANVVVDKKTALEWQDDSDTKNIQRDWNGAKSYCESLNLNGKSDWFLPTVEQLLTITDKSKEIPAIRDEFRNVVSSDYWSSSSFFVLDAEYAWNVYFYDGSSGYGNKMSKGYVRCVRAGQSDTLNFDNLITTLMDKELQNIKKPKTNLNLVKDQFETTAEFKVRVEKAKVSQKKEIAKYQKNYKLQKVKAKKRVIKKALAMTWGKPILNDLKYDADNGYFVADISFEAKKDFSKKIAIKVPRKNARAFNTIFKSLKPQAIFEYDGSSISLKDIRIPYKNRTYLAQFTDMSIDDTRVAVNIYNEINIDSNLGATNITIANNTPNTFDASKLKNPNELDQLLKKSKRVKQDKRKWLFVVGIEQYDYTDNISYAKRSAEMFVKTAQKRLGVPKENSYVMINAGATQGQIKTNMKKLLRRVKRGDSIYFYYNGHGIPVPRLKNEPFMLTADTEPDFVADEKFFSLKNIYAKLSQSKAKKIVAVIDSCFSGVTDAKSVLKGVAATKMVAKPVSFNKEKMVVLTAGKAYQFSNGYNEKEYRLFSFYIMKNIIEGDKTVKELFKHTKKETYDTSIEEYGDLRTQEPTIDGNFRMSL